MSVASEEKEKTQCSCVELGVLLSPNQSNGGLSLGSVNNSRLTISASSTSLTNSLGEVAQLRAVRCKRCHQEDGRRRGRETKSFIAMESRSSFLYCVLFFLTEGSYAEVTK